MPFDLAFVDLDAAPDVSAVQVIVGAIDAIFLVDIVLKFNTAIFDTKRDEWCVDRRKIARRRAAKG